MRAKVAMLAARGMMGMDMFSGCGCGWCGWEWVRLVGGCRGVR